MNQMVQYGLLRMSYRRPRDYFELLGKPPRTGVMRQTRIRDAIKNYYAKRAGAQSAEECAQKAMMIIWTYKSDLNIGPPMVSNPNDEWYVNAHNALVIFAITGVVRKALLRTAYESRLRGSPPEGNDEDRKLDPNWETGIVWPEKNQYFVQVFKDFRAFLVTQPDIDPLEFQVLDQLRQNANREETDNTMAEVFRGESLQVINEPLLKSLQENFSETGWTIELLRVTLAKLRRHADRSKHRKELRP